MKKVKHTEETSTIIFENDEEIAKFKEDLLKQDFIKYYTTQTGSNNI